jgi:hypothetical protein
MKEQRTSKFNVRTHFLKNTRRDRSGNGTQANKGHIPTKERAQREKLVRIAKKKAKVPGILTSYPAQSKGLVRTAQESQPVRHSLSVKCRVRDLSGL